MPLAMTDGSGLRRCNIGRTRVCGRKICKVALLAGFALDANEAAQLPGDAIDSGKAESRPKSFLLRRKEGLEHPRANFRRHSSRCRAHSSTAYAPASAFGRTRRRPRRFRIPRFDCDHASFRHRVARVAATLKSACSSWAVSASTQCSAGSSRTASVTASPASTRSRRLDVIDDRVQVERDRREDLVVAESRAAAATTSTPFVPRPGSRHIASRRCIAAAHVRGPVRRSRGSRSGDC